MIDTDEKKLNDENEKLIQILRDKIAETQKTGLDKISESS